MSKTKMKPNENIKPIMICNLLGHKKGTGYAYGAFDWSYPDSLTRRGRVQGDHGDIAPTIMCQNEIYVYEGIEE